MLMPEVFLLVLSNLLMFSWFDFAKDKKSGFPSIVTKLGQARAEKIIKVLLTTGMLYCVAMLLIYFDKPTALMQSVLLCMYGFLAFIFKYDRLFRPNDSYRVIGDGIFFIPVLILLLC
jgi:1,4-dihydroxy-2-naphthoate octaprenyltransferase